MPSQEAVFLRKEADAWFSRDIRGFMDPERIEKDIALRLIEEYSLKPRRVLEIGCGHGWRLAELRRRRPCDCAGVEPSAKAIAEGNRRFPGIRIRQGVAARLPIPSGRTFDLVIVHFVLHWVSREKLLPSVAEIDRVVADDGHLLVGDFLPDRPTRNRYHHLPRADCFTYKMDYAGLFLSSCLYAPVAQLTFDCDQRSLAARFSGRVDSRSRAACALLRKSRVGLFSENDLPASRFR